MSEKSMLEIAANAAKRYSRVEKKLDGDFKEVSKHIEKARGGEGCPARKDKVKKEVGKDGNQKKC